MSLAVHEYQLSKFVNNVDNRKLFLKIMAAS